MLHGIFWIVVWTFVPALELRASIPYGLFWEKLSWPMVFVVAVVANFVLGLVLYPLMDLVVSLMQRIPVVHRVWLLYVERTRRKIHASVEKWGELAVAVFIGIPLPGTGVYSGALAAYLIGLPFRKFIIADFLGVLVAGAIVTVVCLTGNQLLTRIFVR